MTILANCEARPGLTAAWHALTRGRSALDAVETGIRRVEADPRIRSVGRGGTPNLLGEMACDAALMDGATLQAGAVGCLSGHLHAVSVARKVMEELPHVLLVGKGAERFAREVRAERGRLLTAASARAYRRWLRLRVGAARRLASGPLARHAWQAGQDVASKGTVVFLALDQDGNIAAGTSTSGWAYRYPGRLGDSPVVGAGLYADNRYGACGCTHVGEMTIRAGTARSVVLYMKLGATVEEACREALDDLADLKGGFLGPVMIHAIDRSGRWCVAANRPMRLRFHAFARDDGAGRFVRVPPRLVTD